MKSSLPPATKEQKRRFQIIAEEIGCIVHNDGRPACVHHLIGWDGRRIGHSHTIPLCPDCHTGPDSTHKRKLWFREQHGTDKELLERTNALVEQFENNTIGGGRLSAELKKDFV